MGWKQPVEQYHPFEGDIGEIECNQTVVELDVRQLKILLEASKSGVTNIWQG